MEKPCRQRVHISSIYCFIEITSNHTQNILAYMLFFETKATQTTSLA